MRNAQFERERQDIEKTIKHMVNNGTTRDKLVKYTVNRLVGADSSFTSRQIDILFKGII